MGSSGIGPGFGLERRETRRFRRVQPALGARPIDAPGGVVRMRGRIGEVQHRGEADVGPLEQRAPGTMTWTCGGRQAP